MRRVIDWTPFEQSIESALSAGSIAELGISAVTVIVNPLAGCFSSPRRAARTFAELAVSVDGASLPRSSTAPVPSVRFLYTHYVGHAFELAQAELGTRRKGKLLLVSAGGDGTHGEVMRAMLLADGEYRSEAVATRLPLGTGNDGADVPSLASALAMLRGSARIGTAGHLVVESVGLHPHYGFNIASIGLDAYVAAVTNRMKRTMGGDLYKVVADLATLFYQQLVGVDPMRLTLTGPHGSIEVIEGRFMLTAVGVSGHRFYGGGKKVLPGDENLCAIEPLGLAGKIRLKGLFYEGKHTDEPTVTMRRATRVRVDYARRVPLQVDGESLWLSAESFPVTFTIYPPSVPVLYPKS